MFLLVAELPFIPVLAIPLVVGLITNLQSIYVG